MTLECSECGESDSPSARSSWFLCDDCNRFICFTCVAGIASTDKKFISRVVEGLNNSAVLTKICMCCRMDRASQARSSKNVSPAPSECVVDEKDTSVLAEIAILNTAVKEISTKLDDLGSVVAEPLAKASADTTALVDFFGSEVKLYSTVLKGAKKADQRLKVQPPSFPLTALNSVSSEVASAEQHGHKKSIIIVGVSESGEQLRDSAKAADLAVVKELLSDCGVDFVADECFRLGRLLPNQSRPRLLKVVFGAESEVVTILSRKVNLKGKEKWNSVRIRRSMIKSERVHLSLCLARAQQLNSTRKDRNESHVEVVYFVRPNDLNPRVFKKQGDAVVWSWRDS
ncbi:MAG: hypothetical protein GY820_32070 [Gammaproteobacteria bacterium]|nr:hypothetical protein [Gammaproteobacteria bacterium]